MANTVLDVLEGAFDAEFGPDVIAAVESASHDQLRDLQEQAKVFEQSASVPPKRDTDLRPYVPLEGRETNEVEHDMYLRPSDFGDPARTELAINALKHHLLYCHSIAIDGCLRWLLDTFVLADEDYNHASKEKARARVLNYLRFLEVIEPLVRSGVVVLVEHDVFAPVTQQGVLRDDKAVVSEADFSDLPDESQKRLREWGELARELYVSHADQQLARGLEADDKFGGLDLYLPYRYFEDVLRAIVQEGAREERWPRTVELQVLNDVLTVPVPGLAAMTPKDIVAVRETGQGFGVWRAALERAIERMRTLDPATLGLENEERRLIEQELLERRVDVEREIKRSAFLSHAKSGTKTFVIGGMVALATAPVTGPLIPLMAGGATAAGRAIVDYLAGRSDHVQAMALQRHYLLFSAEPAEKETR